MLNMNNKRGQGLSTNAIILIVLGVVVLAVMVIGFTIGWDKIAPWLSTNNVDTIVTQCSVACSTGSAYDYCTIQRTLKADDLKEGEVAKKSVTGSCYAFSQESTLIKYGIAACSSITSCTEENKAIVYN